MGFVKNSLCYFLNVKLILIVDATYFDFQTVVVAIYLDYFVAVEQIYH
jgi:hypothetical protein